MWQNQQISAQEQENFNFLDVITILSFGLQLQNRESHQIELLRHEISNELQKKVEKQLDRIESKLDKIIKTFDL